MLLLHSMKGGQHFNMDDAQMDGEALEEELGFFRSATQRVETAQLELLDRLAAANERESQWLEEKSKLLDEIADLKNQLSLVSGGDSVVAGVLVSLDGTSSPFRSSPVESLVSVGTNSSSAESSEKSGLCSLLPQETALTIGDGRRCRPVAATYSSPQSHPDDSQLDVAMGVTDTVPSILSTPTHDDGTAASSPQRGALKTNIADLKANSQALFLVRASSDTGSEIVPSKPSKRARKSLPIFASANLPSTPSPMKSVVNDAAPSTRTYKQRGAKDQAYAAIVLDATSFTTRKTDATPKAYNTNDHELYGKRFCQKWRDINGTSRTSFGIIRGRRQTPKETMYEVEYRTRPLDDVTDTVAAATPTSPYISIVNEKVAWGAHKAYMLEVGATMPEYASVPFHWTWLDPTSYHVDTEERLVLEVLGFRLVCTVVKSEMPGAGLGLVLVVEDCSLENRTHFVLQQGELLGLGRYAPLGKNDGKSELVFLLKNFIHDFAPSVYGFGSHSFEEHRNRSDCDVFDLTSDSTGQLHAKAETSHLIRINETNGSAEVPSVCALYDPSGGVQYCLGHGENRQGELRIPVGVPFELKVDYGEDYEKNRVQEGYPRVRGADLERVKQSIDDRDTEAVDDFSKSDANGIDQCIAFLESLLAPTWKTSAMKLKRALVVAVTLRNRVEGIQKEGDQEDEVARLVKKNVLHRVRVVIHKLCTAIGDVQHLKAAICSMPMLKDAFIKCIEFLSPNDLEARDFTTFLATLWTSPED